MTSNDMIKLKKLYTEIYAIYNSNNSLETKGDNFLKLIKENKSTIKRLPITPFVDYKDFLGNLLSPLAVVAAIAALNFISLVGAALIPFPLGATLINCLIVDQDHFIKSLEVTGSFILFVALTIGLAAVVGLLAAIVIPLALIITATRSVATVAHSSINFFSKKDNETENRPGNTQGQAYSMS